MRDRIKVGKIGWMRSSKEPPDQLPESLIYVSCAHEFSEIAICVISSSLLVCIDKDMDMFLISKMGTNFKINCQFMEAIPSSFTPCNGKECVPKCISLVCLVTTIFNNVRDTMIYSC